MRVTSPPAAPSIAAALAALVLLALPSSAGAERWQRPVPGEVTRSFDYSSAAPFAAGRHRGADLAAAAGDRVGAACAGVVVHAGPVPGGERAVTLRCGERRVTHLPLHDLAVRRGVRVRTGERVGALAPGHGGLHVGVRAAGDPFAYEDPLALLPSPPAARRAPPVAGPVRPAPPIARPVLRPARPVLRPARPVLRPARPALRPARAATPDRSSRPLAPPLAWAGLTLAALGAVGTGAIATTRRFRRAAPAQSTGATSTGAPSTAPSLAQGEP